MKSALMAAAVAAAAISGCGGAGKTTSGTSTTSAASSASTPTLARAFLLSSPAFAPNHAIPSRYTCDGRNISPPLRWSGVPKRARELVLVMRDPDAPGGDFVHWALAGIPARSKGAPAGGVHGLVDPGRNTFGSLGYRGPCPPRGSKPHHYVITLTALASPSSLRPGFKADQLHSAALGIATLIGTYARR